MGEQAFEEMVRRALLEANRQEWAEVTARAEEVEPEFSPRYLKRRLKLVNAPFPYAKRKARPAWKRVLRTAACFLLAFALSFGILMASVPEVRAWVEDVFVQWFYDHTGFRFGGEAEEDKELGVWRPTYLPEGYRMVDATGRYLVKVIYKNDKEEGLFLTYTFADDLSALSVDNEHQDYREETINGDVVHIVTTDEEKYMNSILWVDTEQKIAFRLTCNVKLDVLVQIAESIELIEEKTS